jgi:hypothetical protein
VYFTTGREQSLRQLDSGNHNKEVWELVADKLTCDLKHKREVRAVVKLEIKSTRAGKAGHPMIRMAAVCATHARALRELGLELVEA